MRSPKPKDSIVLNHFVKLYPKVTDAFLTFFAHFLKENEIFTHAIVKNKKRRLEFFYMVNELKRSHNKKHIKTILETQSIILWRRIQQSPHTPKDPKVITADDFADDEDREKLYRELFHLPPKTHSHQKSAWPIGHTSPSRVKKKDTSSTPSYRSAYTVSDLDHYSPQSPPQPRNYKHDVDHGLQRNLFDTSSLKNPPASQHLIQSVEDVTKSSIKRYLTKHHLKDLPESITNRQLYSLLLVALQDVRNDIVDDLSPHLRASSPKSYRASSPSSPSHVDPLNPASSEDQEEEIPRYIDYGQLLSLSLLERKLRQIRPNMNWIPMETIMAHANDEEWAASFVRWEKIDATLESFRYLTRVVSLKKESHFCFPLVGVTAKEYMTFSVSLETCYTGDITSSLRESLLSYTSHGASSPRSKEYVLEELSETDGASSDSCDMGLLQQLIALLRLFIQLEIQMQMLHARGLSPSIVGFISPSFACQSEKQHATLVTQVLDHWGAGLPFIQQARSQEKLVCLGVGMVFL